MVHVRYHRSVFDAVIEWTTKPRRPFDHIFGFLALNGYATRVAHPAVAIQDVRHKSQIDEQRQHQSDLTKRVR